MSTEYSTIRLEVAEAIATLTVDRPSVKNALDLQTVNEIHRALDGQSMGAHPTSVLHGIRTTVESDVASAASSLSRSCRRATSPMRSTRTAWP